MSTLDKNWKNLVLAGGGYKGKLYRGVFQALQQKGVVAKHCNHLGYRKETGYYRGGMPDYDITSSMGNDAIRR